MKRRLAIIYDTANVIGHINRCKIELKHVLAPLLLPIPANLVVAIIPVMEQDLASLAHWNEILEGILSIARNRTKSFDLYKKEKEFSNYFSDIKMSLGGIEVLNDVSEVVRLKPNSIYRPYVVEDLKPKTRCGKDVEEALIELAGSLKECKEASLHGVVQDAQMYFFPYIDLLEKGFAIALVTSDRCFSGLVKAYSSQRELKVEVIEVELLADVIQLVRRLTGALRSNDNASL